MLAVHPAVDIAFHDAHRADVLQHPPGLEVDHFRRQVGPRVVFHVVHADFVRRTRRRLGSGGQWVHSHNSRNGRARAGGRFLDHRGNHLVADPCAFQRHQVVGSGGIAPRLRLDGAEQNLLAQTRLRHLQDGVIGQRGLCQANREAQGHSGRNRTRTFHNAGSVQFLTPERNPVAPVKP